MFSRSVGGLLSIKYREKSLIYKNLWKVFLSIGELRKAFLAFHKILLGSLLFIANLWKVFNLWRSCERLVPFGHDLARNVFFVERRHVELPLSDGDLRKVSCRRHLQVFYRQKTSCRSPKTKSSYAEVPRSRDLWRIFYIQKTFWRSIKDITPSVDLLRIKDTQQVTYREKSSAGLF